MQIDQVEDVTTVRFIAEDHVVEVDATFDLRQILGIRRIARTAASWIRTSAQSRWFSSIFLIDSIWPMDLDIRFMIALIFCGSCVWL